VSDHHAIAGNQLARYAAFHRLAGSSAIVSLALDFSSFIF